MFDLLKRIFRSFFRRYSFSTLKKSLFHFSLVPRFIKEERILFYRRWLIAVWIMGVPLVILFFLVDLFYAPEHSRDFFLIRLLVIPVACFCQLLYRLNSIKNKHFHIPAFIFSFYLSAYSCYLVYFTGREISAYYAGISLILFGTLSLMPWTPLQMLVQVAILFFPYLIVVFTRDFSDIKWKYLFPHLSFLISTIFLSVINSLDSRRLRINESIASEKLRVENRNKAIIIEKKTREGIYLSRLSSHFPDQVVEQIRNGTFDISQRIRREVTIIFFDAKDSTERSERIDHKAYEEVLSDCYTNIARILKENGVTVSTYTGDGILGFTNAPHGVDQHRLVCLKAARSALNFCARKNSYYSEKWRKKFGIKIGINTGYATVGFFPSEAFGYYTVVGDAVNEASRFCSKASADSIAVTKDFIRAIGDEISFFNVEKIDTESNSMKGLEGERIDLFALFPRQRKTENQLICPLCGHSLIPTLDLKDTVLVKCSGKCHFSDIISREDLLKDGILN